MKQSLNTNLFFYFGGVLTGLIIKWTDIVPIIGGFMLGLTFTKLAPEFIDLSELPLSIRNKLSSLKNMSQTDELNGESDENN